MKSSDMRVSQPRWRTLGSAAALAVAATPARAYADDRRAHHEWREHRDREEWREHREWREDRPPQDIYFNFGTPQPYYDNDRY